MKTAIFYNFVVAAFLSSLTAFADSCASSGGESDYEYSQAPIVKVQPKTPRLNSAPAATSARRDEQRNAAKTSPRSNSAPAVQTAPVANAIPVEPAVPQATITLVPSPPVSEEGSVREAPSVPGLDITVVENVPVKPSDETPPVVTPVKTSDGTPPVDTPDVAGQIERLADGAVKAIGEGKPSGDGVATLNSTLKSLLGTWLAVARHGDGELGTVELQLDKDGWAKLTTPGADGKPETVKRRVELKGKELKLIGGESDVNLGKIISFNEHQLTLAMANDQVTFVRP